MVKLHILESFHLQSNTFNPSTLGTYIKWSYQKSVLLENNICREICQCQKNVCHRGKKSCAKITRLSSETFWSILVQFGDSLSQRGQVIVSDRQLNTCASNFKKCDQLNRVVLRKWLSYGRGCQTKFDCTEKFPYPIESSIHKSAYLFESNISQKQKVLGLSDSLYLLTPLYDVITSFNSHITVFILFPINSTTGNILTKKQDN